nr:integrase, catalytic region, zinc finger, CCHC-type, peptidase aspartic, catalytic [Tanacetum cinerariifolium]
MKDHPLEQVRGNPSRPVKTRRQLATDPEMCMYALTVSTVEPKNIKEAMADSAWIEAMQEELHQKALYGLKQAPRAWYDELSKFLTSKGFTKGQSIGTPMATKPKLDADLSGNPVDLTEYRSKIGSLIYLTSSRPDIVQAQNGFMERRNQTLVEAARTMFIFLVLRYSYGLKQLIVRATLKTAPSFIDIFVKLSYKLINDRKADISFLHVFEALCYPKNDREDIGKLGAKGDIGFFIGYSANSCTYRVYNRRTKKVMETKNVTVDELSAMAFEQHSSKPRLQGMTSGKINS